jgi:hypothetical protein
MKTILFTLTLISFLSIKSMACDGNPSCPMHNEAMTAEKRAEMATVHTQMAECLKSEKPMEECHKIMAEHMGAEMDGKHSCSEHNKMQKAEKKSQPKK